MVLFWPMMFKGKTCLGPSEKVFPLLIRKKIIFKNKTFSCYLHPIPNRILEDLAVSHLAARRQGR